MEDTRRNIAVGFTAIAGLVGLAVLLMLFGYLPAMLEGGYDVKIRLSDAGGLHRGSRASFRGIDVGQVKSIDLLKPPESSVMVTVRVRDVIDLPAGTTAQLQSALLGGNTTVNFKPGESDEASPPVLLPKDGSAIIDGEAATAVGMMAKELRAALSEPMEQFGEVADRVEILAATWDELGANLRNLTAPIDPDTDTADRAVTLPSILERTDARLTELKGVLEGLNAYVNNEELRENINAAAANARGMTESVTTGVNDLSKRYIALADDMSKTLETLDKLVDSANSPDGTLGKFLTDPALYDNLNDSAQRLEKLMEEAQLLLQKWKAEGVEVKL